MKWQLLVRSLSYTRRLEDMDRYLIRFVVNHSNSELPPGGEALVA